MYHLNYFWILIWLLHINTAQCAYLTGRSNTNSSRFQRSIRCGIDHYSCKDGSCILDGLECNGIDDCPDGSDETVDCRYFPCNSFYGYRCDYGACIAKSARCNGIIECRDNSDERACDKVNSLHTAEKSCSITMFTCKSGECIDNAKVCDGYADCSDSSDETQECATFSCSNAYRCKYGGCAVKHARCNGLKDCVDASDEEDCPSVPYLSSKPVSNGSCIVPIVPKNGIFLNTNSPIGTFKQGDLAPNFHALVTKCNRGFKTIPSNRDFPICFDKKWTQPPLECARFCTSVNNRPQKKTSFVCKHGGTLLDSCTDPVDGTIATTKCEYPYESASTIRNRICRDGTWDYPIEDCKPVCGPKLAAMTDSVNGKRTAKEGDFPWHVAIYSNQTYICGGSIVSERLVVTGAICFTDYDGKILPKENYLIGAGKHYHPYNDKRDRYAQYVTIKQIFVPTHYQGAVGNYDGDIAVVVLNDNFIFTKFVLPVCIDWDNHFEAEQLFNNNKGVVAGWSFTPKTDVISLELQELFVPYIPYGECFENSPLSYRRFLTHDKICAGYLSKGISVCTGDSGGGLTFQAKKDERYYLRGIVSSSPVTDDHTCDVDHYAAYTSISKYLSFIQQYLYQS